MDVVIDTLTGLPLAEGLHPAMEALIAQGGEFSLVTLDIDSLFFLNQDYGNEAGDDVFRLIAKHIGDVFPSPCMAFRDTRDQFDVLLPNNSKEEAFLKAERLRQLVCEESLGYISTDGTPMRQSVSLGVSSFPDDGSRPADVVRRADSALLRAKKTGPNLVCLARDEKLVPKTSHYTQAQLERLSLVSEDVGVGESALLREALDDLLKKYDVDQTTEKEKAASHV